MLKIVLSAALTPGLTVHTATFEAAAKEALRRVSIKTGSPIKAKWVCDQMCAEGGKKAALELVRRGVHAIVGHFSSEAARAAIPIYRKYQIPLILPCSSDDSLTDDQGVNCRLCLVFRLSAPDSGLFHAVQRCLTKLGINRSELAIWSACSPYGTRLSFIAERVLGETPRSTHSAEPG